MAVDGFESPPKKTVDFGPMPDKGQADKSQVKSMIENLRKEHFKIGQNGTQSNFRSSQSISCASNGNALKTKSLPWATMKTNYALGRDGNSFTTDNQARFYNSTGFSGGSSDMKKNKDKIANSSLKISTNNFFSGSTSMKS